MPKRKSGETVEQCVSRAMSSEKYKKEDEDLNQEQKLGKYYGMCKEIAVKKKKKGR